MCESWLSKEKSRLKRTLFTFTVTDVVVNLDYMTTDALGNVVSRGIDLVRWVSGKDLFLPVKSLLLIICVWPNIGDIFVSSFIRSIYTTQKGSLLNYVDIIKHTHTDINTYVHMNVSRVYLCVTFAYVKICIYQGHSEKGVDILFSFKFHR